MVLGGGRAKGESRLLFHIEDAPAGQIDRQLTVMAVGTTEFDVQISPHQKVLDQQPLQSLCVPSSFSWLDLPAEPWCLHHRAISSTSSFRKEAVSPPLLYYK